MQHVGHVYRVRKGMADEYARRHATVWPEIEALLRRAGVRSFTIYAWGETIFSHMTVEDYEKLVREYNSDPVGARWDEAMSEILEYPNSDPETGWPEELREIWSLDEGT
jgi:L-rhamnose mutarotase